MSNGKFFILSHGWANKYYWLDITEKINPLAPPKEALEELVKNNRFTFTKQSGTTSADILGSTLSLDFFSKKLVNFLRKNNLKNFSYFKIKFSEELKNIGDYYFLEVKDSLPGKRKSPSEVTFYLDDWEGQEMFSIEDTYFFIVTERIKEFIKKSGFKNVEFDEVVPAQRKFKLFHKILGR